MSVVRFNNVGAYVSATEDIRTKLQKLNAGKKLEENGNVRDVTSIREFLKSLSPHEDFGTAEPYNGWSVSDSEWKNVNRSIPAQPVGVYDPRPVVSDYEGHVYNYNQRLITEKEGLIGSGGYGKVVLYAWDGVGSKPVYTEFVMKISADPMEKEGQAHKATFVLMRGSTHPSSHHSAPFCLGPASPRGRLGALPCVVAAAAAVVLNLDMARSTPKLSTARTMSAACATATCARRQRARVSDACCRRATTGVAPALLGPRACQTWSARGPPPTAARWVCRCRCAGAGSLASR